MAYTKQTWSDGAEGNTPITAERLNHMEAGIEAANKVVTEATDGIMSAQDKVDLENIKDDSQDNTEWITLWEDGDGWIRARKKYGIVTVLGQSFGNKSNVTSSYTTVAVLPDNMIPEYSVSFLFHSIGGSFPSGQASTIVGKEAGANGESGAINLYATSGHNYWKFSVSYVV